MNINWEYKGKLYERLMYKKIISVSGRVFISFYLTQLFKFFFMCFFFKGLPPNNNLYTIK